MTVDDITEIKKIKSDSKTDLEKKKISDTSKSFETRLNELKNLQHTSPNRCIWCMNSLHFLFILNVSVGVSQRLESFP